MKNSIMKLVGICVSLSLLCACDAPDVPKLTSGEPDSISALTKDSLAASQTPLSDSPGEDNQIPVSEQHGTRGSKTDCPLPEAPGTLTSGNEYANIDYSNSSEGYVCVEYLGTCPKVKVQITGPNQITYTYDLFDGVMPLPLTSGSGNYTITFLENIQDARYAYAYTTDLSFENVSEFGPYLYPNQYVNFTPECATVKKGAELASTSDTDLDVVANVYNYIISNITYDHVKAETVRDGYFSDVDEILNSGTGICLDYAAVMTSMLRSQSIPTRLEVGYVSKDMIYHAWISVYLDDIGWVNGVIQFNGNEWKLMDPTFAADMSEKSLRSFIGDGTNYSVKYVY